MEIRMESMDDGGKFEHGFKWAFISLFGQDVETFTSMMLLHIDQLEKKLDTDKFQDDGPMAAFWVDMVKALDAGLVVTESSRTEPEKHDTSNRYENDTHAEDADSKHINNQEPMAETKDHNDSLVAQVNSKTVENDDLKAQIQEKVFANATLKNELRKLKGNIMDTNFAKPSILRKPVLQPLINQSVVRQPNAFQSEQPKFSKPRVVS
nr:hypothetical protein [Tanacetum cinerariifolium]